MSRPKREVWVVESNGLPEVAFVGVRHGYELVRYVPEAPAQPPRTGPALHHVETIAARVHESWMTEKRAAGVTSRKLESGEELMAPYSELSEQAKELDRATVRTVLAAMGGSEPRTGPAVVERRHREAAYVAINPDMSRDEPFPADWSAVAARVAQALADAEQPVPESTGREWTPEEAAAMAYLRDRIAACDKHGCVGIDCRTDMLRTLARLLPAPPRIEKDGGEGG